MKEKYNERSCYVLFAKIWCVFAWGVLDRESKEDGIKQADEHAINDCDDYHTWELCEYNSECDLEEPVYQANKTKSLAKAMHSLS